jgi:hypothetical protein
MLVQAENTMCPLVLVQSLVGETQGVKEDKRDGKKEGPRKKE